MQRPSDAAESGNIMKKSTKGAAAAGTAAVLLLGSAGSLAYWTQTQDVTGGTIQSGDLSLSAPDCGDGWIYDTGEDTSGAAYTPGTSLLVPGDVISETCTTAVTATGEHMRGTITASAPTDISPFSVGVDTISDGTTALVSGGTFTEKNSGDTLSVTITVTFPSGSTTSPDTRNLTKSLDNIALTATQAHAG